MDKKYKTIKDSLKKTNEILLDKSKKLRTVTGRSPKVQDYLIEKKHSEHDKHKFSHMSSYRAITKSIAPIESQFADTDKQSYKLKLFHSNISCSELPLTLSEKTIKLVKSIEKKPGQKLTKTKKKTKMTKLQKEEQDRKTEEKCGITRRKVAETKDDYEMLYRKTEQILREYKTREEEWEKQKTILMEQLQDFRRKSLGMALTNCSTYSINRRNFF